MCQENRAALSVVETKEEAIRLYKKTIDWALEEGFPKIDTLRRHFSDCESEGVFVDRVFHGEVLDSLPVYVFHNCSGMIHTGLNVGKRIIPMLYFANGCDMSVRPSGPRGLGTYIPLYIFGDSRVAARDSADAVFRVYKFDVK